MTTRATENTAGGAPVEDMQVLIDAHFDGSLDEAGRRRLDAAIRSDAALRRDFHSASALLGSLREIPPSPDFAPRVLPHLTFDHVAVSGHRSSVAGRIALVGGVAAVIGVGVLLVQTGFFGVPERAVPPSVTARNGQAQDAGGNLGMQSPPPAESVAQKQPGTPQSPTLPPLEIRDGSKHDPRFNSGVAIAIPSAAGSSAAIDTTIEPRVVSIPIGPAWPVWLNTRPPAAVTPDVAGATRKSDVWDILKALSARPAPAPKAAPNAE